MQTTGSEAILSRTTPRKKLGGEVRNIAIHQPKMGDFTNPKGVRWIGGKLTESPYRWWFKKHVKTYPVNLWVFPFSLQPVHWWRMKAPQKDGQIWLGMSQNLRPSGSERCLSPSSGKSSHSQKVPVLDPWPLPTWNQHKHEYNTGGIDILSHGLMNINLWVLPLRNYSNGRKKSQLKTYSATFLRDVQANLLGVNKKLPHVLVVIPCSQGARPCWQTWRWRKAQQKWRYNQFNQPKWGYNGTYNHTTSTFIYTWSENRYPPFWPFEWEKIW